jgi:hypothetical protein
MDPGAPEGESVAAFLKAKAITPHLCQLLDLASGALPAGYCQYDLVVSGRSLDSFLRLLYELNPDKPYYSLESRKERKRTSDPSTFRLKVWFPTQAELREFETLLRQWIAMAIEHEKRNSP